MKDKKNTKQNVKQNTKQNVKKSAFKLIKRQQLKTLNATGYLYEHIKTKAQIIYIDDKSEEKVFSIALKTPIEDDSGLPHILEHTVLAGSRKYPSKEPFLELMKGSVNTFVNAMAYPDYTIYPVASKNTKDFYNLVDVYLDAVFNPLVKENINIFKQEGWHYEYDKKEKKLSINGIVYNEMKGAYSSPDSWIEYYLTKNQYTESQYHNDSGGFPEKIPTLTYKKFCKFHDDYYHPSNSYTLLSGSLDLNGFLKYFDQEYLKNFKYKKINAQIRAPKFFNNVKNITKRYAVEESENLENKSYFCFSTLVNRTNSVGVKCSKDSVETTVALKILGSLLTELSSSPLKRMLVDNKISSDVLSYVSDFLSYPAVTFMAIGGNAKDKNKFAKMFIATLKDLSKNGIDKEIINAAINKMEFTLKDFDKFNTPKGITYALRIMQHWISNHEPFERLQIDEILKSIRLKVKKERYFEKLISKYLLKNINGVFLTLVPDKSLTQKNILAETKKLNSLCKKLSEKDIQEIVDEQKKLKIAQEAPDLPENLEKIPLLELKDLNSNQGKIEFKESSNIMPQVSDCKELLYDYPSNGITYTRLLFDASCVNAQDVQCLMLLTKLLGKVDTKKYNYKDLSNTLNSSTGGVVFSLHIISVKNSIKDYRPYFTVEGKCLNGKQGSMFELITEILLNSKFSVQRVKELIAENRAKIKSELAWSANTYNILSSTSSFGGSEYYKNEISGLPYYKFLCQVDDCVDALIARLVDIVKKVFVKDNLTISLLSDGDALKKATKYSNEMYSKLPSRSPLHIDNSALNIVAPKFEEQLARKALIVGGNIQYVCKTVNAFDLGVSTYSGDQYVLANLISLSYIWNQIRIIGGAYGGEFTFTQNGIMTFYSYRDPNIVETLNAFNGVSKFLKEVDLSERELRKNIIGVIGEYEKIQNPLNLQMMMNRSTTNYLSKIPYGDLQKLRDEILSTTIEQIKSMTNLFDKVAEVQNYSVAGPHKKISEHRDLFDVVDY